MPPSDDLLESAERLYERLGVPGCWKKRCLDRFDAGCETYGPWNHLRLTPDELREEFEQEVADVLNFAGVIEWSRAYHGARAGGKHIGFDEEDADAALDLDLIEAVLEVCRLLDARDVRTKTISAPRG